MAIYLLCARPSKTHVLTSPLERPLPFPPKPISGLCALDILSPKSILSSFGELLKGSLSEFQELPKGPLRQKEP